MYDVRRGQTQTNLHPNRVQQALADPADSWYLANGEVLHKVLDRIRIVRQVKLPVWLILDQQSSLYENRVKEHTLSEHI